MEMKFENFIGTYENFLSKEECKKYIDHYKKLDYLKLINVRNERFDFAKDKSIDMITNNQNEFNEIYLNYYLEDFLKSFWEKYMLYYKKYNVLELFNKHTMYDFKLQKTSPEEGYHVWHCENMGKKDRNRIASFIVYLNTIEKGGETEFLYYSKRIKAEEGKLIIFPSSYTHTHRGNPPLEEDKYILTGWIEFNE